MVNNEGGNIDKPSSLGEKIAFSFWLRARLIIYAFIGLIAAWLIVTGTLWAGYQISPLTFMPDIEKPLTTLCINNNSNHIIHLDEISIDGIPSVPAYSPQLKTEQDDDYFIIKQNAWRCRDIPALFSKPAILKYHFDDNPKILTYIAEAREEPGYYYSLDITISSNTDIKQDIKRIHFHSQEFEDYEGVRPYHEHMIIEGLSWGMFLFLPLFLLLVGGLLIFISVRFLYESFTLKYRRSQNGTKNR
ncbi:MAG: hypothetical protein AB7G80_09650 [Dongiaceae bacterium]